MHTFEPPALRRLRIRAAWVRACLSALGGTMTIARTLSGWSVTQCGEEIQAAYNSAEWDWIIREVTNPSRPAPEPTTPEPPVEWPAKATR